MGDGHREHISQARDLMELAAQTREGRADLRGWLGQVLESLGQEDGQDGRTIWNGRALARSGYDVALSADGGEQPRRKRKRKGKRKAGQGQRVPDTDGSEGFQGGGWGDVAGGPSGAGEGGSMAATVGLALGRSYDNGGGQQAMQFTEDQLRAAWEADEVARLSMMALGGPMRPQYAGLSVPEPAGADELDDADVVAATMELAARTGGRASFGDVADTADELALSRDDRTTAGRASALAELAGHFPGGEEAGALELARRREVGRLTGQDGPVLDGRVADIVARNRDLLSEQPRRGQTHLTEVRDEDCTDHAAPSRGGVVHPEVARILRQHGLMDEGANTTHPVKSAAQREREECRARAGHQPGLRTIQELHRAAMRSAYSSRG